MFELARTGRRGEARPGALVKIVADSGPAIGLGHVGRCLALMEALGKDGAVAVDDPAAREFLEARGVSVSDRAGAPVLVLDMREPTDAGTVRTLQAGGTKLCLLDDLGDGRTAADLVVDPPTAAEWPSAGGRRLAGFEHVLLRREIRELAPPSDQRGVFLSMGGTDPAALTVPLAEALAGHDPLVALGPGYEGAPPRGARLLASQERWAQTLAGSQVFVSGYGHSLLEAAYLGVPAVSVVFLPEHLPHARAFCEQGTAVMLDLTGGGEPSGIAPIVSDLLADARAREAMSARGRALVDGRGAERVAAALLELA